MRKNKYVSLPQLDTAVIFLTAAGLLLVFNITASSGEMFKTGKIFKHRERFPYIFLGDRFRGIETFVGKAPYIGYYTNKNLDDNLSARQFAQAQLVLAPSILDLNNTEHEFIIFDCTTPQIALAKIKEIGAKPLKANPYGIILARHPDRVSPLEGDQNTTFDKTKQKQRP